MPEEAIVPLGGKQYVIKLLNGPDTDTKITQRVEVKVGIRRPGRVEILEGLSEADEVITAGQQRVQKDGTTVKVLDLARAGGKPAAASTETAPPPTTPRSQATVVKNANANAVTPPIAALPSKAKPVTGPNPCTEGKN